MNCGAEPLREGRHYGDNCLALKKARHYGLTLDQFRALGDSCQICGSTRDLHIDHDHVTGAVRGLLCQLCNNGLGMFRDSPELLLKASQYLMDLAKAKPAPAEEAVH